MAEAAAATRRVKIVATLGPACADVEAVTELASVGADVFRLNTAHLTPADIPSRVATVREAERRVGRPLAVLCDLAGPKLRVARDAPPAALAAGSVVSIGGTGSAAAVRVEGFDPAAECQEGCRVSLNDGRIVLVARAVRDGLLLAEVVHGGEVRPGMGVNLPEISTSLPSLTGRDRDCLAAAVAADVDLVALSFVRTAADVAATRALTRSLGGGQPIVAKLEKAQAVEPAALAAILAEADLVMVARGDLGAETAPERVPVLQKEILSRARRVGVAAITATEMLDSMIEDVRPTRAEAADVANAVFDGSDAVLLTAETAIGAHPALAVAACARIVAEAEAHPQFGTAWSRAEPEGAGIDPVADAVAAASGTAAAELGAAAIVCFTLSGRTAVLVARHRPGPPILALTPSPSVARRLAVSWGVTPRVVAAHPVDHERIVRLAEVEAVRAGLARAGDTLVVTHGLPAGSGTNVLRVHRVGDGAP